MTTGRADTKLACTHMGLLGAHSCFKGWLSDAAMQATALSMSPCQLFLTAVFLTAHAMLPYFGIGAAWLVQQRSSASQHRVQLAKLISGTILDCRIAVTAGVDATVAILLSLDAVYPSVALIANRPTAPRWNTSSASAQDSSRTCHL